MNQQNKGQVTLSKKKQNMVMLGCLCLMLTISAFGLSLSTIQAPLLAGMGAGEQFSLVTILASLAMCIMTPVGGRLADMWGTRAVVLVGGAITTVCAILLPFMTSFIPFVIVRFILAMGMGMYISLPFTLVRVVFPADQVPKKLGYITGSLAIGSLIGGTVAGFFMDHGLIFFAIFFPALFLIAGIPLIYFSVPNTVNKDEKFDLAGFLLLAAGLAALFIGLNYGPKTEWGSIWVYAGILGGIVILIAFALVERKVADPLIPMRLFANEEFSLLLVVGFLSFFYLSAMNAYVPMAVQNILGASNAAAGSLQVPRTIITLIFPTIAGIWMVKKYARTWYALAFASLLVLIPFAALVFIGPHMPLWFVIAMISITGFAESFRAVSITPAAQSLLDRRDLGVGTSLLSFINALAQVIAGSLFGMAYDAISKATPGIKGMTMGVDTVFLITAGMAFIGLILVVFVYRPMYMKHKPAQTTQKQNA